MKKISKRIFTVLATVLLIGTMINLSQIEAEAGQYNRMSGDEINASYSVNKGFADVIMTADDFLFDGEVSADYKDIHEFLDSLDEDGVRTLVSISDTNKDSIALSEKNEDDLNESSGEADEVSDNDIDKEDIIEEEEVIEEVEDKNTVDKDDWRLILVNKQNPVPEDYDANLTNINASQMADERIIDDIYNLLDAAQRDGVNLMICSAYRSYDRQTTLFNNKMNKLMNQGMSYMEAYAVGSMSVTVPGTSEHQLGLALDILTSSYIEMDDGFGDTEAGIWLAQNAPDYGFILRYPKEKEEITGIIYEPWHFRYVGTEYAREITDLGVCLEEYLKGEY